MNKFNYFVGKLKYFGISLVIFGLIVSIGFSGSAVQASAATETKSHIEIESSSSIVSSLDVEKYNVENLAKELFGDVQVESSEFLYNLDESSDYIYVTFQDDGYAVFLKDTMELMEYSPQGKLSYPNTAAKKYYGGPNIYLTKEENCFVNTVSGESVYLSKEEATNFASEVRVNLLTNYNNQVDKASVEFDYSSVGSNLYSENSTEKGDSKPSIGDYSYITGLSIADGTYIANYQYFLSDPTHGTNSTNFCGAVAAQLLLSYHNYYSDRRIISNEHLNGNSTTDRDSNPNYCEDPMSHNSDALGSRGILADGSDDDNSYFAYVVKNVPGSATTSKLKNGLKNILKARNNEISGSIDYTVNSTTGGWFFTLFSVGSSGIVKEIDAGRPTIILMQESLGGLDHFVVAYGYHEYTYPSTGNTYLGYITHFGWGSTRLNVWVNSAWCYSYTSMKINHTHTYNEVGEIGNNPCKIESICSVCGHRTDAYIRMDENDRYTERTIYLPQNDYNYKEYLISFAKSGNELFQTFGSKDVKLYLYDLQHNQLAYSDNEGYNLNALFNYSVN